MGKNLQYHSSGVSIENHHPGCMWSMLHILKYHHWRYIKKKLHHKSGSNGKHPEANSNPVNNVTAFTDSGAPQHFKDGNHHSTVIEKKTQSSLIKASVKSRMKAKISGELSKSKGRHCRRSTYPAPSPLMQTDSFRPAELSDEHLLSDIRLSDGSPTIAEDKTFSTTSLLDPWVPKSFEDCNCEDNCGIMLSRSHLEHHQVDHTVKELIENDSLHENSDCKRLESTHVKDLSPDAKAQLSKEIWDELDMINIDKDFFLKIIRDSTAPLVHQFHNQQALTPKMRYSVSFPLPGSSYATCSSARKGNQKQESIEKLQASSQEQEAVDLKYKDFIRSNSMPPVADANFSLGSPHHQKKYGSNQVAVKHSKNLEHKIGHALKDNKNEKRRITMDAILHKVPHGQRFSKDLKSIYIDDTKDHFMSRAAKDSPKSSYDSDRSLPSTSKSELYRIRRTVSLNRSLDRYCQLYDASFNREAKQQPDKLKRRAEHVVSPQMIASIKRIFSLPDISSYLYHSEDSSDFLPFSQVQAITDGTENKRGHFSGENNPGYTIFSEHFLQLNHRDHVKGNSLDSDSGSVDGNQLAKTLVSNVNPDVKCTFSSNDLGNLMTVNRESTDKQSIGSPSEFVMEVVESTSVPEPDSELLQEFVSEDAESSAIQVFPGKLDSLENHLAGYSMDTPTLMVTEDAVEELELSSKNVNNEIQQFHVDAKDRAEFDYIRDILRLSGFTGNELPWSFDEQPLHPSVFEEAEGCMVLDPECSGNEGGNCHNLLLFDLINEVLVEIYAKSCTSCPTSLSSLSHVRPMPVGHHVLKEVWANIRGYLSATTEGDQLLDYAISRDLANNDGWMNLQYDIECVSMGLADLIFEDLLQEVVCSS